MAISKKHQEGTIDIIKELIAKADTQVTFRKATFRGLPLEGNCFEAITIVPKDTFEVPKVLQGFLLQDEKG